MAQLWFFFPPGTADVARGSVLTEVEVVRAKYSTSHCGNVLAAVHKKRKQTKNKPKQTKPRHTTTRKSPSQICVSSESRPTQNQQERGQAQQKQPPTSAVEKLHSQRES